MILCPVKRAVATVEVSPRYQNLPLETRKNWGADRSARGEHLAGVDRPGRSGTVLAQPCLKGCLGSWRRVQHRATPHMDAPLLSRVQALKLTSVRVKKLTRSVNDHGSVYI